jgi:vancomycin resistance protein YoaR
MDATVYEPYVDLKFRNDRDHWLWIETDTDAEEGTITFSFYGTADGRTVEIIPGEEENVTPPPPPVYTEDPSLPTGTLKQVDWAVQGLDVTLERVVRRGDEVLLEDEFVSQYEPWSAKYLYGPGTTLPAGVAGIPAPTPTTDASASDGD